MYSMDLFQPMIKLVECTQCTVQYGFISKNMSKLEECAQCIVVKYRYILMNKMVEKCGFI